MPLAAKIDEFGKPAWLVLMVLGFIIFWPLGLAILAYIIWSGRMGWKTGSCNWRDGAQRMGSRGTWWTPPSSGNHAFDEYRQETLKRLEDEQREFKEFLDRLRFAKDKTEFDQFMADRRNRPQPPAETRDENQPR